MLPTAARASLLAALVIVCVAPALIRAAVDRSAYDEVEMLCLVNRERVRRGAWPLGLHDALARTSLEHSRDQARMRRMTHDSSSGKSLGARCEAAGFRDWRTVGENVAYGYNDEATCMKAWMDSPGHRENILNPKFTHFGSAVAYGGDTPYYTQNFAGDGKTHDFPECPRTRTRAPSHAAAADGGGDDAVVHMVGGAGGGRHPPRYDAPPSRVVAVAHDASYGNGNEDDYADDYADGGYGGSDHDDTSVADYAADEGDGGYGGGGDHVDDGYGDEYCDADYSDDVDGDSAYGDSDHDDSGAYGDHADRGAYDGGHDDVVVYKPAYGRPGYDGDDHYVDDVVVHKPAYSRPGYDGDDHYVDDVVVDKPAYGRPDHDDVADYREPVHGRGDYDDSDAYGDGHDDVVEVVPAYGRPGHYVGGHDDTMPDYDGDQHDVSEPSYGRPDYEGDYDGDHHDINEPAYGRPGEHHDAMPDHDDKPGYGRPGHDGDEHYDESPDYDGDDHHDEMPDYEGGDHRDAKPAYGRPSDRAYIV